MKFLKVILTLSFLLLLPLLVVESSSSIDNNFVNNITRGSFLSLNDTSTPPYWLSASGNLAFGFYQLPCPHSSPNCPDRYVVGVWFVKSPSKTLVWTANINNLPLREPSSIHFTREGKLMLRIMPDNKEKPLLPDLQEPVSYAMMHDDGNFILYGSESQIIWESFDYPTDTILGGQKLRAGEDLISGNYRFSVRQSDGFIGIYEKNSNFYLIDADGHGQLVAESVSVVSDALDRDSLSRPVFLSLDITGKLYLASSDDEVVKVFYKRKQPVVNKEEGDYIYRATLSSIGRFNLHKERIDGNNSQESSSSIVWSSSSKTHITSDAVKVISANTLVMSVFVGVSMLVVGLLIP